MKKVALVALSALLVVSVTGCFGPQKVTRALDDWANQEYVNTPWLIGNVVSSALLWVAFAVTQTVDIFINAYYFWVVDAQPFGKGVGTPFNHKVPTVPAGK